MCERERERETHTLVCEQGRAYPSREREKERGTYKESHAYKDVGKEGNKRGRNKLEISTFTVDRSEGKMTRISGFRRWFYDKRDPITGKTDRNCIASLPWK